LQRRWTSGILRLGLADAAGGFGFLSTLLLAALHALAHPFTHSILHFAQDFACGLARPQCGSTSLRISLAGSDARNAAQFTHARLVTQERLCGQLLHADVW
jgi:hypothetical protein